MKRSTARWTTAVAAAALCVLPATGWAQTTSPAQQPPSSGTAGQHDTRPEATQQAGAGQEHLQQAKQALDDIQLSSVTGQSRTQLTQLKRHMSALERSMASGSNASGTRATGRSTRARRGAPAASATNWQTEVTAMDRILSSMLGSGAAPAAGAGETSAATGTTGTTGRAQAGVKASTSLDATTRAKLEEVRTHITAFAAAMSGTAAQPSAHNDAPSSTTAPSSSATSGTAGGMTGAAGTSGSMPSTTTAPSTTAQEQPTTAGAQTGTTASQPGSTAAAGGQVDQTAVKRHLTEARNSLGELTQLPAAAQLTGEARTQVSQLIGNFNELITTNADWHAPYAKLKANLAALLGPEDGESTTATSGTTTGTTTGTTGTTGTTPTQSTPANAGAASIDPAIRAKLVEFRTHLQEFERAAGGAGAASSSEPSSTTPTTAPSTTAPSTADPSTTAPSTASSAGSSTSATSTTASPSGTTAGQYPTGTSGSQPDQSAARSTAQPTSEAMGHGEAMRHIDAIEAILNGRAGSAATGTTGSTAGSTASSRTATAAGNVTLDRAQLEQVRMHLTELRRLLAQAKDDNK